MATLATTYNAEGRVSRQEMGNNLTRECALIDDLRLGYDGNKAVRVEDYGYDPVFEGAGGYNAPDGVGELTYDANGNVTRDTGRGISRIEYNHLNLPHFIYFADGHRQTIDYDGRGLKRSVTYSTATTPVLANGLAKRYKTDYIRRYGAGRVMRGDSLEMIIHPCGYFDGEGNVRYYLHDFQGNVTMTVDKDGKVLQHTRYYPYGEPIDIFAASVVSANAPTSDRNQPFLYGGKELERMHGLDDYDFGARRLPSHLPLWTTQDPCLEQYYPLSPYNYCAANPIRYIDPTGMDYSVTVEEDYVKISAIFVATKSDKELAQKAANNINGYSGKYALSVETENGTTTLPIKFDVSVQEAEEPAEVKEGTAKESIVGLTMTYVDSWDKNGFCITENPGNPNLNGGAGTFFCYVYQSNSETSDEAKVQTATHEMLHNLGAAHSTTGIMTEASSDPARTPELSKESMQQIIEGASITSPEEYPVFNTRSNGTPYGIIINNTNIPTKKIFKGKIN